MAQDKYSIILDDQGKAIRVGLDLDNINGIDRILNIDRIPSVNHAEPARIILSDTITGVAYRVEEFASTGLTTDAIFEAEQLSQSLVNNTVATPEELLVESNLKAGMNLYTAQVKAKQSAFGITESLSRELVDKYGSTQYSNLSPEARRLEEQKDYNKSTNADFSTPLTSISTSMINNINNITSSNQSGKTDDFKAKLTSKITNDSVVFNVSPTIDESRSASYDPITPVHHPGTIHVYKSTNARNFNINGKLVARTSAEASKNLEYINLIRSWVMPYYGEGTGNNAYTKNRLGAPPDILNLTAYGPQNLKNIPVVLSSYSWTYPDNVDYIPTLSGVPFPVIIDLSLMLMESNSPEEFSNFDLNSYKLGLFNEAFKSGSPTQSVFIHQTQFNTKGRG